ncbi:unnamed protein product [Cyclocybe aegerita]|uniref:Uncharacterized protein n=1 Tax=Cyclocybe aegerita TaxID=1973307 RepID=A0A8S0W516_CYCAE|nr:unnamed protein product [Cyclocybe aegerita]
MSSPTKTSETQRLLEQQRKLAEEKMRERAEKARQRRLEEEREKAEEEEMAWALAAVEQVAEEEWLPTAYPSTDEEDEEVVVEQTKRKGKGRVVKSSDESSSEGESGSKGEGRRGKEKEKGQEEEEEEEDEKDDKEPGMAAATKGKTKTARKVKSQDERNRIRDEGIAKAEASWPVTQEPCAHCIVAGIRCQWNPGAMEKWRMAVENSKGMKRAPPGILCLACMHAKITCVLPATKWMCDQLEKNNDGKRKRDNDDKGDFEPEGRLKRVRVEEEETLRARPSHERTRRAAAVGADQARRRQRREQAEASDDPLVHLAWSVEKMRRQQQSMSRAVLEQLEVTNWLLTQFVMAYEKAHAEKKEEDKEKGPEEGTGEGVSQ